MGGVVSSRQGSATTSAGDLARLLSQSNLSLRERAVQVRRLAEGFRQAIYRDKLYPAMAERNREQARDFDELAETLDDMAEEVER